MTSVERWLVRWSSWATGVTGLVYLWMKYILEPTEPFAALNHPLQPWVLKAHIMVAPVMVFAIGMISVSHVWKHWRGRVVAGRRTGVVLGLSLAPMVLTGYLIQAIVRRPLLAMTAWAHIGLGILFLAGFAAHLVIFRRRRARRYEPRILDAPSG